MKGAYFFYENEFKIPCYGLLLKKIVCIDGDAVARERTDFFCFFLFQTGDNKPIWQVAEEREENKHRNKDNAPYGNFIWLLNI